MHHPTWSQSAVVPPLFSHLDPEETPVEPAPSSPFVGEPDSVCPLSDHFRHSGWRAERQAVWDAFNELHLSGSRRAAFARCGSSWWIQRHRTEPDRYRLVADHCHDRFCIPCGKGRQATVRTNAYRLIDDHPHRFLTLTIRNRGEDLRTMLNHLYTSFRKLRQRALWKGRVRGGVAFCEIVFHRAGTRSTSGALYKWDQWHPHLHCILDGQYIDRPDLTRAWLAVTGDSFNVNIKLIRTKHAVVSYVTKYATKPLPHNVLADSVALTKSIDALRGRRLVLTFGTWKSYRFLEVPGKEDWELVDHFDALTCRAQTGDTLAKNILAMMHTADPRTGEFFVTDDGPAIDDSS